MSHDQQTLDADAPDETTTEGDWLTLPSVERAVAHATPFPAFDAAGEWRVQEAVYDTTLAQMRRLTEQEVAEA